MQNLWKGNDFMVISGLLKTTLLDYPGHVAATIFLGGCNMRCPFCHNASLIATLEESYSMDAIFSFLKKRQGILEGICVSGGEPTLHKELPDFMKEIKQLGYLIKLDTNGSNPSMLRLLIREKLIDYVAMDVKSCLDNYQVCCGCQINTAVICDSIDLLKSGLIAYEFRTTLVSELHNLSHIEKLGTLLEGAERLFLQNFVDSPEVPTPNLHPVSLSTLNEYKTILQNYVPNTLIRGESYSPVSSTERR